MIHDKDDAGGWMGIHWGISWKKIRRRTHEILDIGLPHDTASRVFDHCIVTLIILNVVAFTAETVPEVFTQYGDELELFNVVSVAIFTVEYVLRIWAAVETPVMLGHSDWRTRLHHATRPMQIIDLLVIMPFYISFFIVMDLRVLRVLRLLRLLKLVRYSPALHSLMRVIYQERRALFGALLVMMSLLLFSASGMYFLERDVQPDRFGSVPEALWWAIATLTTVGYGDVTPITPTGKFFGGIVILFGLGMFALPIGIMATAFSQEASRRDFVVTWSMVAEVPLFSRLTAAVIAEIIPLLNARVHKRGALIMRRGDRAEGMFFITSGEVVVETGNGPVVLKEGEFFGEMALIENRTRESTVHARTNCQLLVLDGSDFEQLVRDRPEVGDKVREVADARQKALHSSIEEPYLGKIRSTRIIY